MLFSFLLRGHFPPSPNPPHTPTQTLFQSSTMPVLSMHNYAALPAGSASYSLGLSGAQSGLGGTSTYPYSGASAAAAAAAASNAAINAAINAASNAAAAAAAETVCGGYSSILGTVGGLSGLGATNPLSSSLGHGLGSSLGGGYTSGYSNYTNPLLAGGHSAMNMKLKTYDDLDLLARSYGAGLGGRTGTTPSSPIPSAAWGLDGYGLDGVNPAFMHAHHSRLALEMEGECWNWAVFVCAFGVRLQCTVFRFGGFGGCVPFVSRTN